MSNDKLADGFDEFWSKRKRKYSIMNPCGFARMIWEASARYNRAAYEAERPVATIALGPDEFVGTAQINGHWYDNQRMIRVAQITYDGSTCTVPLSSLVDTLGEDEAYQVRVTTMRKAEFDRLEEFAGW